MKSPCKRDCPDRSTTCHAKGNCKHGYDEFVEYREQLIRERAKFNLVNGYVINNAIKIERKTKR